MFFCQSGTTAFNEFKQLEVHPTKKLLTNSSTEDAAGRAIYYSPPWSACVICRDRNRRKHRHRHISSTSNLLVGAACLRFRDIQNTMLRENQRSADNVRILVEAVRDRKLVLFVL